MRSPSLRRALVWPLLLLAWVGCGRPTDLDYVSTIDAWHAERLADLRGETGWLTLVGLHPLHPGANEVGSGAGMDVRLIGTAPARVGTLLVAADSVALVVAPGVAARVKGNPASLAGARLALASDVEGAPTIVEIGSLSCYVITRGERRFLRVKDSESAVRRDFAGIERFPVDPRWRVVAKLAPSDTPRSISVPDVLGGVNEEPCPGTLEFRLRGRKCRLLPTGAPGEPLFIVFGDASNGHATYGGGRFLETDPPAADGSVVLDFNRAINPPCAFTPYATCPLPPEGNELPFAVEAGEKRWGEGAH